MWSQRFLCYIGAQHGKSRQVISITPTRKATSQGVGGRGRRIKCSTSTMNKHKKRSYKKYRGQGR